MPNSSKASLLEPRTPYDFHPLTYHFNVTRMKRC